MRAWTSTAVALSTIALAVSACSSDNDSNDNGSASGSGDSSGGEVTIYSSLPLQGASKGQSTAILNGEKLALEQADHKAGDFAVKLVSLDDSTASAGKWEPQAVSANARKALQDDSAVAYIGEFNSGATAISLPILNEAGMPQISVSSAVGLTTDEPGADEGEPDKYYPTGERTLIRVTPRDTIQGRAIASLMKDDGCQTVALLDDQEVYGAGLARTTETAAKDLGLTVTKSEGIDPTAPNYRSLASALNADCVVYAGVTANNAVQVFKDVAAALPDAKLYGPDGVAEAAFTDPDAGGIPAAIADRVKVTIGTLAPDEYPAEGREFFADYKAAYGTDQPDPYAIYGYEMMQLALDAIERAGSKGNDRAEVLKQLFATRDRESVLGTYDIEDTGDNTLTDFGVYRITDGSLEFDKTVKAQQ